MLKHKLDTGIEVVCDYDRTVARYAEVRPIDSLPSMGLLRRPTPGEIVEGERLGGLRAGRRMRAQ